MPLFKPIELQKYPYKTNKIAKIPFKTTNITESIMGLAIIHKKN